MIYDNYRYIIYYSKLERKPQFFVVFVVIIKEITPSMATRKKGRLSKDSIKL